MIRELMNRKNSALLTSDRWHVLRARWTGGARADATYERTIVSEHDDSDSAARAGRELLASFQGEMLGRERKTRDQVLVRRPGYRSLKVAKRAKLKR